MPPSATSRASTSGPVPRPAAERMPSGTPRRMATPTAAAARRAVTGRAWPTMAEIARPGFA